jgi:hypothetical protein
MVIKRYQYRSKPRSYLVPGLGLWTVAGLLTWFFYSLFVDANSKVGFIDSDKLAYRKGIATVVEKRVNQTNYELRFTYPEESNSFQGNLSVSQEEFEQAQIGQKMPIFYGIYFPRRWMPVKSGKVFYLSMLIIGLAALLYLIGTYMFYRTLKSRATRKTPPLLLG